MFQAGLGSGFGRNSGNLPASAGMRQMNARDYCAAVQRGEMPKSSYEATNIRLDRYGARRSKAMVKESLGPEEYGNIRGKKMQRERAEGNVDRNCGERPAPARGVFSRDKLNMSKRKREERQANMDEFFPPTIHQNERTGEWYEETPAQKRARMKELTNQQSIANARKENATQKKRASEPIFSPSPHTETGIMRIDDNAPREAKPPPPAAPKPTKRGETPAGAPPPQKKNPPPQPRQKQQQQKKKAPPPARLSYADYFKQKEEERKRKKKAEAEATTTAAAAKKQKQNEKKPVDDPMETD